MEFETYDDLIAWMEKRGNKAAMTSALSYLTQSVHAETVALTDMSINNGTHHRRTKRLVTECQADARGHYLEEINEFLAEEPRELTHVELISYRRRPHAWAVARMIHDHLEAK